MELVPYFSTLLFQTHSCTFTGNTKCHELNILFKSWWPSCFVVCVVSSAKRYQKQGEKQSAYEVKAFKKEHLTTRGVSNESLYHKAIH